MKRNIGIGGFIVSLILIMFPMSLGAATYTQYVGITIANNNASGFAYMPVILNINNSQLASYGYISASGLNTNFAEGGTNSIYSLTTSKAVIVIPVLSASQQRTYQYQLGYSPAQSDYPFSSGYGGNVTIADAAALELGSNFEINVSGYFDASKTGDIVSKTSAFALVSDGVGNITATIPSSSIEQISQTQNNQAVGLVAGASWKSQTFLSSGYTIDSVILLIKRTGSPGTMTVGIYATSAGKPTGASLSTGSINASVISTGAAWVTIDMTNISLNAATAYAIVASCPTGDGSNKVDWAWKDTNVYTSGTYVQSADSGVNWTVFNDYDFAFKVNSYIPSAIVTSSATSGEHNIKVTADTTNLKLYIDTVEEDSVALAGASVPDNANNWVLCNNNVMPYIDYYKHTVSGTLKAWYQPVTLIIPTALADRSGNGNSGVINFGTNHPSITVTIGGITPSTSYEASSGTGEGEPADVVYSPGVSGFENTSATGSNLPYYAIFDRAASSMGISTLSVYGMMVLFISLVVFVAVSISTSSQMMGLIGAGMVTGIGAAAIIGIWVVFIVAVGGGMLLYVYRRT